MKNTKIGYLYRDASNYKKWNEVVIRGSISPEQIDIIIGCLDDELHFIPRQVGLPEERFENPDGTSIIFDEDYLGRHRGLNALPGPFVCGCEAEEKLF